LLHGKVDELGRRLIADAESIVAFTGAGISTSHLF
jgi:NAD-dependent SIR2 family protein deacetylase